MNNLKNIASDNAAGDVQIQLLNSDGTSLFSWGKILLVKMSILKLLVGMVMPHYVIWLNIMTDINLRAM